MQPLLRTLLPCVIAKQYDDKEQSKTFILIKNTNVGNHHISDKQDVDLSVTGD